MNIEELIEKFREFFDASYKKKLIDSFRKDTTFVAVDFSVLAKFSPEIAEALLDQPGELIEAAETSIKTLEFFPQDKFTKFHVRFFNLPEKSRIAIRNIRSEHLEKFIVVEGIVRQKSDVRPRARSARFECPQCGNIITVIQTGDKFKEPSQCSCGRKGRFHKLTTEFIDSQRIVLEEMPEVLEGDAQPKRMNLLLEEDLVSPISDRKTNPGSKIRVCGTLKEIPKYESSGTQSVQFDLVIISNYVEALAEDYLELEITEEEEEKIKEIGKSKNVFDVLVDAIAPSIYGYENIKLALLLQQLGGVEKVKKDKSKTRGDMHVLLVGDPGAGKSQLLKRMSIVGPKAKFVSGRGASGAGLTAAVVKDEFIRGWALEAGALVLANNGLCAIDELDKMTTEDRTAMHEALEQQTISISKANIQATLIAKTSVVAAANPKMGRFDPMTPIAKQINLPPTLINRFDLIFIVRDLPSKNKDIELAEYILKQHQNPDQKEKDIDTNLLRRYIAYAKKNFKPKLTDKALERIKEFYVDLRNSGQDDSEQIKPIPITARQLEALVRLSEASAKARLSNTVTKMDAERAINILTVSMQEVGLDPQTKRFDIDLITTGTSTNQRSKILIVKQIIEELEKDVGKVIPIEEIVDKATKSDINESQTYEAIDKLKRIGDIFEPRRGHIQRIE
ncbi:MAG TPA: minichromosome maintenance protein MCM [Candidatus Woesearchaeota archaeon]|nr:minichromosome maintenance protein MCM [Candidatus Woesearchaeota archaeon]